MDRTLTIGVGEKTAEALQRALVDRILTGELSPGARLDEQGLADTYGVSRTPVREALQMLASTGLVVNRPRRGAVVRTLDIEELAELFEALGEIEALCAKYAAQRMTLLERRRLENVVIKGAALVHPGQAEAYSAGNVLFHEMIFDGAHNRNLKELAHALRQQTAAYRSAQFRLSERTRFSQAEHEAILAHILRADGDGASQAMRDHIAATSVNVLEILAEKTGPAKRA